MSNKIIIFALFSLLVIISCGNSSIDRSYISEDTVQSDLKSMYDEWIKCKNKEVPTGFQIAWKIELKSISSIGGLYGRGHIYGNNAHTVNLRWDTESDFYKYRKPEVTRGDILMIKGTFWGISEKGDVIVDVKVMEIVNKGWLKTLLPFW